MGRNQRFGVIGLGRFGTEVATWLASRNYQVLAIDRSRSLVDDISGSVDNAVCLDCTNETALQEVRIQEMDVVVVAIGDTHVENSILTTALLQQFEIPMIVARAKSDLHARILKVVGAHHVVNPEKEMGERTAQWIATPGLSELIPLAEGASIAEMPVPASFAGKTLLDLRIRSRYGITIVGIRRLETHAAEDESTPAAAATRERKFLLSPDPSGAFERDDILVVAGSEEDVKKFAMVE